MSMRNDMLTQALCNQDFLKFALLYNGLVINAENEKDNDELWLVLANLIEYPESIPTIKYIYSVEEFTEKLLHTLENYKSKDLLLRIIKTKPSGSLLYAIWSTYIDTDPATFTSRFSYNCLHGIQWLEDIGEKQSSILSAWNSASSWSVLGRRYSIDRSTGELHIIISVWWLKEVSWDQVFTPYKSLYEQRFPTDVVFAYLEYRYPNKTLFDVFDVSLEELMKNHK